jgi:LytS/YehU family sensor histidine kinase
VTAVILIAVPESNFLSSESLPNLQGPYEIVNAGDYRIVNLTNGALSVTEPETLKNGHIGSEYTVYERSLPSLPYSLLFVETRNWSVEVIWLVGILILALLALSFFTFLAKQELVNKDVQLSALQHQINPHFIYNTMEVFSSKMELYGHYAESEAMSSFASIFRSNINIKTSYSTVREELAHIRDYINIQRLAYANLNLLAEIPDELLSCKIIRFVFQPIVENCIIHGSRSKSDALTIVISAERKAQTISFCISDNGLGMESGQVTRLNEIFKGKAGEESARGRDSSIGLSNINARLKLFYNDKSRLKVNSIPNEGTSVSFTVPA